MALDARQSDIFNMVLSRGAILVVRGLVPGLVLAYFAAGWLDGLLAGVKPGDLLTFSSAIVL
jgi:ABC-type lipoprotein release transport system permease subunit